MADLVDKQLGTDAEMKVSQAAGVITLEVDLHTPMLIGKLTLGVQEAAVLDAIAAKYPNEVVVAALGMLKSAIAKLG